MHDFPSRRELVDANYKRLNHHIEVLLEALQVMMEEKRDYMRINHLGNPEEQHTIKLAKQAIATVKG